MVSSMNQYIVISMHEDRVSPCCRAACAPTSIDSPFVLASVGAARAWAHTNGRVL